MPEINLKNKKIMALIPARSGSKSVLKKNIIPLHDHPLMAYSIAAAKLSKLINRVIVTTDSEEFAEIAKSYGAEAPFLRPKEISGDHSLDIEFFRHALEWLEKNEGYAPDLVVQLRPVTPAREPDLIDKAILEIEKDSNATALRSAHLSEHTGYKLFRKRGGYINFFGKEDFKEGEEYYNRPRQILPPTYNPNGYVDVVLPKTLKETETLHGSNIIAFITERIADIDYKEDVRFAEELLRSEKYINLLNYLNNTKK